MEKKLIDLGGKFWGTKDEKIQRVYFDLIKLEQFGLSGNKVRKFNSMGMKFFYDLINNKFCAGFEFDESFVVVVSNLMGAVK
jgi:hypothetical protein